jgi:mRNA interferase MazF
MRRDYLAWYKLKTQLEKATIFRDFHEREIWWCSLGANIGFEEDGKNGNFERPVLVIRKYSQDLFFGVPLTSTIKQGKYYFKVKLGQIPRSLILSQGRALCSVRLRRKIYKVHPLIFSTVLEKYRDLFA